METVISADRRPATITEFLRRAAEQTSAAPATFHRSPSGDWLPTTWSTLWNNVQRAAAAFHLLGLGNGDRLAILARTCPDWQVAELGALTVGAAVVGIDPQAAGEQVTWILERADVSGLVVDTAENLGKISVAVLQRLRFVLLLDEPAASDAAATIQWRDAVAAQALVTQHPAWTSTSDTPAMVIYTSGTTGTPKAIEYTHRQLMEGAQAMINEVPDLGQSNRLICWLPMASLFQRMINLVALMSRSKTYFVDNPREIMARIVEVRPTVFFSVPRFYEKLHDGIQAGIAVQSGIQKRLVETALAVGARWSRCIRSGERPGWQLRVGHAILDRLVLRRIRASMGGEIKWMLSGSAAAPVWLLEFFHSIGFLVLEAYGITENPVPIAVNRPDAFRFGSVGRPFAMNQLRFDEQNEVLVKGPALFGGYVGEGPPKDRYTSDGYYRTGDYGRIDEDGFLFLTGRVAEIIKTSTGRRISPVAIEGVYRQSRYIDQVMVLGNNRPHLVALIVLNGADRATSRDTIELIEKELNSLGQRVGRHERIRAFTVLSAPLSVENGELTPTLKFRRDRIEARYADVIDKMYRDGAVSEMPVGFAQSRQVATDQGAPR